MVVCDVVLFVCCVVMFLSCVCVCDLFLFLPDTQSTRPASTGPRCTATEEKEQSKKFGDGPIPLLPMLAMAQEPTC